jgi:hypothetical protein
MGKITRRLAPSNLVIFLLSLLSRERCNANSLREELLQEGSNWLDRFLVSAFCSHTQCLPTLASGQRVRISEGMLEG